MSIREWLSRHAKTLAVAGALLLQGSAAQAQFNISLPTLVTTDKGVLVGQSTQGIRQFLGVPYAAPPTGTRRWKAPAAESAYVFRDASRFAKHCPQSASPFGVASTSEDCLYLNVYTPPALDVALRPAPVMVWFHPGAFQYGESDDFNPTALVKKGVVVVTLNYRLGALGGLAHPALTAESADQGSGNYGLMDQQAALRWVQRNIRSFGGDPAKVTIFGESAGGVSVYAHIAAPDSAGLFQRAIAMSGSYFGYSQERTLAVAEAEGQAYATAVGCPSQSLSCLRAVPVATLLANQSTSPVAYLPNTEPSVLPESIFWAIYSGHINKVPLLHGITQDEYRLFVALRELEGFPTNSRETYHDNIMALLGFETETAYTMTDHFYQASKYGGEAYALGELGTNVVFACSTLTLGHYVKQFSAVYHYTFDDKNAPQDVLPPVSFPYGAYHGADVQYILDSSDGQAPFTPAQQTLADRMKSYWANFARTGNPNGTNLPVWPAYADVTDWLDENGPNIYMELGTTPRPFNSLEFFTDHGCLLFGPPYSTN